MRGEGRASSCVHPRNRPIRTLGRARFGEGECPRKKDGGGSTIGGRKDTSENREPKAQDRLGRGFRFKQGGQPPSPGPPGGPDWLRYG